MLQSIRTVSTQPNMLFLCRINTPEQLYQLRSEADIVVPCNTVVAGFGKGRFKKIAEAQLSDAKTKQGAVCYKLDGPETPVMLGNSLTTVGEAYYKQIAVKPDEIAYHTLQETGKSATHQHEL
eukprot:6476446-Amphidinium_carterae.4